MTPSGSSSLLSTVAFKPVDAAALARVPGVSRLETYRGSFLDWGKRRLWVIAPPADGERPLPSSQLVSGSLALATARFRRGGWAVLSQALAAEHHLRVGDAFTLPSPRPQRMRLAAVTTNLGWPPGAIILSSARLRARVGEPRSERIRDPDRAGCAGGGGARSCPAGAGTRERPDGGNGRGTRPAPLRCWRLRG